MKHLCLTVAVVLAMVSGERLAKADYFSMWSSVATACTPVAAAYGDFTTGGGNLTTGSGKYTTLFCAIPPIPYAAYSGCSPPAWRLGVATTSSSTLYGGVTPYIIRVAKSDGSEHTIAGGTQLRNTSPSYPTYSNLSEGMDFQNYVYYAQIQLYGATAGHPTTQTLYWLSIDCDVY
jgi:hypothetical protein